MKPALIWMVLTAVMFVPVAVDSAHAVDSLWATHRVLGSGDVRLSGEPVVTGASTPRRWYFRGDAVALKRDTSGGQPMAVLGITPVLGTGDLKFDFQSGYRLLVGRTLGKHYRIDYSYMDLAEWNETASVRNTTVNALGGNGNLSSPFSNFGNPAVAGFDYSNFVSLRYRSNFDDMELNLWHQLPMPCGPAEASWMIGARYMTLREQLDYHSVSDRPLAAGNVNDIATATNNRVLGLQIGGLFEYQATSRCWIDCEFKAALCDNKASLTTDYTNTDNNGTVTNYLNRVEQSGTTYLADLSVTLTYQFSPSLTSHIGYRAIWIDNLAMASNNFQSDAALLMSGPAVMDDTGNIAYHGPHVGLTLMW